MKKWLDRGKVLLHRIRHWEYWPFSLLYIPVYFYFIALAMKCRSFFFFTSANPKIEFGGMLGEKKSDIFRLIPPEYLPKFKLFEPGELTPAIKWAQQIGWPLVAKPDIGERGRMVEKIHDEAELKTYVKHCPVPFLLQEWVSYPIELGVFYVRNPEDGTGEITSIVEKRLLKITGDGRHSVHELLAQNIRAKINLDLTHWRFRDMLKKVPVPGEEVIVESIGNHCRGTAFLDASDRITPELEEAIGKLTRRIPELYFGRFDLRCASYDGLSQLKQFKILELNGAGAEPGHIYQPGYPLLKAYQTIFWHLSQLARISRINHQRGIRYWDLKKGLNKLVEIRRYNAKIAGK